jgi:hypothetical protein
MLKLTRLRYYHETMLAARVSTIGGNATATKWTERIGFGPNPNPEMQMQQGVGFRNALPSLKAGLREREIRCGNGRRSLSRSIMGFPCWGGRKPI